jgi:hypothetical protein
MAKTLSEVALATDTFFAWVQKTNYAINAISTECLTANTDANGALTVGNTQLNGIFTANTIAVGSALRGGNVQSSGPLTISSNTIINGSQANISANVTITGANVSIDGMVTTSANVTFRANSSYTLAFFTANTTAKIYQANVDTFIIHGNVSMTANLNVSNTIGANIFTSNTVNTTNANVANLVVTTLRVGTVSSSHRMDFDSAATIGTSAQLISTYAVGSKVGKLVISVQNDNANAFMATEILILNDGGTTYTTEYALLASNGNLGTFSANCNTTFVRVYMTPTVANTTVKIAKMLLS